MSLKTVLKNKHPESEVTNEELIREADKPQEINAYASKKEA